MLVFLIALYCARYTVEEKIRIQTPPGSGRPPPLRPVLYVSLLVIKRYLASIIFLGVYSFVLAVNVSSQLTSPVAAARAVVATGSVG